MISKRRCLNILNLAKLCFNISLLRYYSIQSGIIYCLIFQALYGSKSDDEDAGTTYNHQTTVGPPGEEDPLLCSDPKVNAIFNSAEGHTYAFKGIVSMGLNVLIFRLKFNSSY